MVDKHQHSKTSITLEKKESINKQKGRSLLLTKVYGN